MDYSGQNDYGSRARAAEDYRQRLERPAQALKSGSLHPAVAHGEDLYPIDDRANARYDHDREQDHTQENNSTSTAIYPFP